jgi:CheY-like chemotaxis protein
VRDRPKSKAKVLVVAREAVIAALLGMLLELEGYEPSYTADGERPEEALARLRPPLVIVLDGELEAARSDLFFARAARAGARVVLFAPPSDGGAVAALARARGLAHFAMPCDRASLVAAIEGGDGARKV